jgi:phage terminase large subunit-like protein
MSRKKTGSRTRAEKRLQPSGDPDYSADVQKYIDGVLSGRMAAGREQRLAVLRHVRDLRDAKKRGWIFNAAVASWSIWFIESKCRHTKNSVGAKVGDPIILTAAQRFIVWSLFGWRDSDGFRRYRKAHIEVARKFGKSTFAACLLLLVLLFDIPEDAACELYTVATNEKQAKIVWREARAMIRKSRALLRLCQITGNSIILKKDESFLQALKMGDGLDGMNPSMIVKDELHAWRNRHRDAHEKLETGDGARMQPLTVSITTAGSDRSEIWKEERDWAVRAVEAILTGEVVDDRLFSFICCIDTQEHPCPLCNGSGKQKGTKCGGCKRGTVPADDPFDRKAWPKANPNLGQSVGFDKYEAKADRAKRDPGFLRVFLRYYANVIVSSSEKAFAPGLWAGCSGKPYVQRAQFCRGAVDLGRSDDFASWCLVFPSIVDALDRETHDVLRTYDILSRSYTCEARAEAMCNPMIDDWIDRGLLICHPGDQVDFDEVERDLVEMSELYSVISWGFDATFAPQMMQRLINVYGLQAHKFAQNPAWYNPGVVELRKALKRRDVAHGGDPVLQWQADNLVYRRDARDLCMPDKAESAFKIDAMVALHMAVADILFHAADDESRMSVYENRGLRTV